MDHAVTSNQKAILKAFGLTAADIRKMANELSGELQRIEKEAKEKKETKQLN